MNFHSLQAPSVIFCYSGANRPGLRIIYGCGTNYLKRKSLDNHHLLSLMIFWFQLGSPFLSVPQLGTPVIWGLNWDIPGGLHPWLAVGAGCPLGAQLRMWTGAWWFSMWPSHASWASCTTGAGFYEEILQVLERKAWHLPAPLPLRSARQSGLQGQLRFRGTEGDSIPQCRGPKSWQPSVLFHTDGSEGVNLERNPTL